MKTAMNHDETGGARLLDAVIKQKALKNDAALSRELKVLPPHISKIRNGKLPVTASTVLRVHELTGWKVDAIYKIAGITPLLAANDEA